MSPVELIESCLIILLLVLVSVAAFRRQSRLPYPLFSTRGGLAPWRVSGLNFCLWLWLLWCAFMLAGLLCDFLDGNQASLASEVVTGFVSIGVALTAQLVLLRVPALSPRPLDAPGFTLGQAARAGLLDYLITLPVILLAAFGWQQLLALLKYFIPALDLPLQEPVLLFMNGGNPFLLAALAFVAIILAPMNEELLFRGGLYRFLKGRTSPRVALTCTSLLFGLAHFNLNEFLPLVLIGALLVRTYERTGRIIAPIVFHASFNAVNIAIMLTVPVS